MNNLSGGIDLIVNLDGPLIPRRRERKKQTPSSENLALFPPLVPLRQSNSQIPGSYQKKKKTTIFQNQNLLISLFYIPI